MKINGIPIALLITVWWMWSIADTYAGYHAQLVYDRTSHADYMKQKEAERGE